MKFKCGYFGGSETGFSKEQLKGTPIADVENTTLEHLYPKDKAFVMRDVLLEPTHQYSEFSMTPLRLYLVYADLSGGEGNQYELIQSVRFEKAAESTNGND